MDNARFWGGVLRPSILRSHYASSCRIVGRIFHISKHLRFSATHKHTHTHIYIYIHKSFFTHVAFFMHCSEAPCTARQPCHVSLFPFMIHHQYMYSYCLKINLNIPSIFFKTTPLYYILSPSV